MFSVGCDLVFIDPLDEAVAGECLRDLLCGEGRVTGAATIAITGTAGGDVLEDASLLRHGCVSSRIRLLRDRRPLRQDSMHRGARTQRTIVARRRRGDRSRDVLIERWHLGARPSRRRRRATNMKPEWTLRHVFVRLEELAADREREQVATLAGPIRPACELHGWTPAHGLRTNNFAAVASMCPLCAAERDQRRREAEAPVVEVVDLKLHSAGAYVATSCGRRSEAGAKRRARSSPARSRSATCCN
jgi:hypothetical protein